jgi:hypothetical protein
VPCLAQRIGGDVYVFFVFFFVGCGD